MSDKDTVGILYVDNDSEFADLAAEMLKREESRFHIETAASASEGLVRLDEAEFDCIVSDYNMPGQNGIEFLQAVRDEYPSLPFILYTGKGSEAVAADAISAGVTDYLQKSTGSDQYTLLANRIRHAVERREAERERTRQLEAIETAQEGISILNADGHYIYVNQRFADLHGYDPEGLIGEHWELVYPDEDIPEVREEILPTVKQAGYWHGETTSLQADGDSVPVDHTLATTERGEIVCTVRDISDQKERERELHEKTARLEALFENSPDLINVHNTSGEILDPNPHLAEKTGYEASELADMQVWELDQEIDPDTARTLWQDMELGENHRREGRYERVDGSEFPVEVHISRLRFQGKDRFVAIARDITDQKQREQRLAVLNRVLRHNIRNDVLVIRGHLDSLTETASLDDACVDVINERLTNIVELSQDARRIERLQAKNQSELVEYHLSTFLNERLERLSIAWPDADVELHAQDAITVVAHDLLPYAIDNLLENAVKHNDADSPHISVDISEESNHESDAVTIEIEDNGPGLPCQEAEIFGSGIEKPLSHSTGTGIWLAQWIVQSSNGRLSVESNQPDGTEVRIKLQRASNS